MAYFTQLLIIIINTLFSQLKIINNLIKKPKHIMRTFGCQNFPKWKQNVPTFNLTTKYSECKQVF